MNLQNEILPRRGEMHGERRREILQNLIDLLDQHGTITEVGRVTGASRETLYSRVKAANQEGITSAYFKVEPEQNIDIPKGILHDRKILDIVGEHRILIINDIHVPYHDHNSLRLALEHGREKECDTVIINGDFMDFISMSHWERSPLERMMFNEEIESGKKVLGAIRKYFPRARIISGEGNHERRLIRKLWTDAPELAGLPDLSIEKLLNLNMFGVEYADEDTYIKAGLLNIIHGHEINGGGVVNVARVKYLKAGANIAFGHHHCSQSHIATTIEEETKGGWAIGHLSDPHPRYSRNNSHWAQGFAVVYLQDNGNFVFRNKVIIQGEIY